MRFSRRSSSASRLSVAVGVTVAGVLAFPSSVATAAPADPLRDVVMVGNSVSGTVSFLDGHTFANLGSINVVPDLSARLAGMNPVEWAGYQVVKSQEGGDRFADDVFASPDGRTIYVSRGNLDDAVAIDIASKKIIWRLKLDGFKADHAVLSPDGKQFIVSATTAQIAEVIDTATGKEITSFPTGTYPHQNDYSADGKYIYNSSIGITALPKLLDGLKGQKQLTVVDAKTFKVVRSYTFSEGIRPSVFTSDGKTMYTQLSYLNGFVEFNLVTGQTTRTVNMPYSAAGKALAADSYPQNSAHHGLAFNGDQSKLCDVGTIDDYTAIVSRPGLTTDGTVTYPTGSLPYWATTSVDGTKCLVSLSNAGAVSVVDFATAKEVARIPVGTYPQRERRGQVLSSALATLS